VRVHWQSGCARICERGRLRRRLLQRYGYLLPKLNPDSEIAQEQRLILQERAQFLARAAERNDEGRGGEAAGVNAHATRSGVPCKKREAKRSAFERWFSEGAAFSARRISHAALRPDVLSSPREQRTETAETDPAEAPLVSSLQANPGGAVPGGRSAAGGLLGETIAPDDAGERGGVERESPGERGSNGGARHRAPGNSSGCMKNARPPMDFRQTASPCAWWHHPNPYADAPSLYDLYVQASWPASGRDAALGAEFFGAGR